MNDLSNYTVTELEMELARRRNYQDWRFHSRHWNGLHTVNSLADWDKVQNQGQQSYYGAPEKDKS